MTPIQTSICLVTHTMSDGLDLGYEETRAWLSRMRDELYESETPLENASTHFVPQQEVRLRLGEVKLTIGRDGLQARVALFHHDCQYNGVSEDRRRQKHGWLIAAATVEALNAFLAAAPAHDGKTCIHFIAASDLLLPSGDHGVVAVVDLYHLNVKERLVGAVFLEKHPQESYATAVLDAVNRRIGNLHAS
jgi:hypothetical protein